MPPKVWLGVSLLVGLAAGHGLSSATRRDEELLRLLERQGEQLEVLSARLERLQEPARCTPGVAASSSATVDLSPVQAELQRLREGLATREPSPPAAPSVEEPEASEQARAESLRAVESSQQLLNGALASRRWSETEAASFRGLLRQMTPQQREEAIQRLFQAINEQQLRVDVAGPPF